jgi:hypothetical protein
MQKRTAFLASVLVFAFMQVARSSPDIQLRPGMNEVSIKVFNDLSVDIASLALNVESGDLPDGITVAFGAE